MLLFLERETGLEPGRDGIINFRRNATPTRIPVAERRSRVALPMLMQRRRVRLASSWAELVELLAIKTAGCDRGGKACPRFTLSLPSRRESVMARYLLVDDNVAF